MSAKAPPVLRKLLPHADDEILILAWSETQNLKGRARIESALTFLGADPKLAETILSRPLTRVNTNISVCSNQPTGSPEATTALLEEASCLKCDFYVLRIRA